MSTYTTNWQGPVNYYITTNCPKGNFPFRREPSERTKVKGQGQLQCSVRCSAYRSCSRAFKQGRCSLLLISFSLSLFFLLAAILLYCQHLHISLSLLTIMLNWTLCNHRPGALIGSLLRPFSDRSEFHTEELKWTSQRAPYNTLRHNLSLYLASLLILFNFSGGLKVFSMKSNLMNECVLLIKALKQDCHCRSDNKFP